MGLRALIGAAGGVFSVAFLFFILFAPTALVGYSGDAGYWSTDLLQASSVSRNWEQIIPFLAYPQEVRKVIYTTNAIESLNSTIRRSVRARGHFPTDEAATKLIWLQLREVPRDWKMPARTWQAAKAQFAMLFGDRFVLKS